MPKVAKMPLVSIITPSYNQGKFIEDTILSVKNQNYSNIEHIIIDGGSKDNTLGILKKYEGTCNMRWISESDEGQADAINKGFEMSNGEIIGWLNSDDIYFSKDTISYIVTQFEKYINAQIIFGNDVLIDQKNIIFRIRKMPKFKPARLLRINTLSQPATFFKREVIIKQKLNKFLNFAMDLEYWLRLHQYGYEFQHVNRILAGNRIHKNRKMILYKYKAEKEVHNIRKKYGFENSFKFYFLTMIDKFSFIFRNGKGIREIMDIKNGKYNFTIKLKQLKFSKMLRNQIYEFLPNF